MTELSWNNIRCIFEKVITRSPSKFERVFLGWYQLLGFGTLAVTFIYWLVKQEIISFLLFIGIPYTVLWIIFRLDLKNDRVCARLMLDSLDNGGKNLCWIYREQISGAYEANELHYLFINKRHGNVNGTETGMAELYEFIIHNIPQISYGYSKELEKSYQHNPGGLKTQPVHLMVNKSTQVEPDNASNGW